MRPPTRDSSEKMPTPSALSVAFASMGLWVVAGLVFAGCQSGAVPSQVVVAAPAPDTTKQHVTTNFAFSTPTGEVVIIDRAGSRATFATKSGVVFKQVDLDTPETFETHRAFEAGIHQFKDTISVEAEWIGERVYWRAETSGLKTHAADELRLVSKYGSPLVQLCGRCNWVGVFDASEGKTVRYSVEGVATGIPIDVWTKTVDLVFRASSSE